MNKMIDRPTVILKYQSLGKENKKIFQERKENTEMFTVEELREKKKFEVLEIAKSLGVQRYKGKTALTKDEIIDGIIEKERGNKENDCEAVKEDTTESDKNVEQNESDAIKVVKAVKELEQKKRVLSEEERQQKRIRYIEDAAIGTLLAFKTDTGKVKSAKIVKRSTKHRKFKVETAYGAEYIVPFDDVLWVRTNKRWPKGVYNLLKGIEPEVD